MKHYIVTFLPEGEPFDGAGGKQVSVHEGANLVEAAGLAGIILNTVCGQKGVCGKCSVNIDGQSVLGCQYRVTGDVTVLVPKESRFVEHKILTEGVGIRHPGEAVIPDIYRKYIHIAGDRPIFGLSIDIGTTTVVVKLIDMKTGQVITTVAELNPQAKFGDDVISRIAYAANDRKLAELNQIIVNCLNRLIAQCCAAANVRRQDIYEACIVGNTTMNHIFLRLPVIQLGQAPYRAFSLDSRDLRPQDVGLDINPEGNIHTLANIAGFVGADTTAVALATALDSADEISLAIDIGTNGEVVLGTKDKLLAASCAAGPAFEGARIACGSRAIDGAIEAVVVAGSDVDSTSSPQVDVDVIGEAAPRSICGSGLIDATAAFLDLGVIDATGRLAGQEFILARDAKGKPSVYLTQKDIREVQLAKAAIRAGIRLLENRLSIADADVKHVFLAGAFGNFIRPQSALRIGLLPDVALERIQSVGNAASAGAQMALISSYWRRLAAELAKKVQYVEIANEPGFQEVFADCMSF
jgi:uncharacterized 2Fe-2S/4Fe-4S cluster protein (DUF4445 family)